MARSLHIDYHIERLHKKQAHNLKVKYFSEWISNIRIFLRVRAFVASRGLMPAFNSWKQFIDMRREASVSIQTFSRRILAMQAAARIRKKRSRAEVMRRNALKRMKYARASRCYSAWNTYAARARHIRCKYARVTATSKRRCVEKWKKVVSDIRDAKILAVPVIQRVGEDLDSDVEMLTVRRRDTNESQSSKRA